MSYSDLTKSRRRVNQLETSATFSQLMLETIDVIHALKLFYEVGARIRVEGVSKFPACQIRPLRCEEIEKHLSGMRVHNDYHVNPIFIIKHPNDTIAMQQVLFLAQAVKGEFAKASVGSGPFIFSTVAGHFNTNIVPIEIEPLQLISNDTIVFNSGINIVFSVWEKL